MEEKKDKNIVMYPEIWDELTEADWVSMLKLREHLLTMVGAEVTVSDIRIEAARCLLLNRGIRTRTSNEKYFLLVRKAAEKLDWLWQEDAEHRISLVYRSTKQLLPKWGQLLGPMSHGGDLVFGEFKEALTLCQAYDNWRSRDDGDPMVLLQQLAGLLYRRRNPKRSFPRRIAYDKDSQELQLTRGQRMPRWFLWGVYAWFSFFCEYLATGVFIIDGREVCFSPVFRTSPDPSQGGERVGLGLNAIAMTLAESQVFGDFEDVLHTPLMRVMMKLLHDHETYEKQKKELKKK